jgi:integrase
LRADPVWRPGTLADDPYRLMFRFAAGTGCRLGEVLGLKWRAIDFDAGTATITHQLDRRGEYVALKTRRSRRTLVLPGWLVSELRALKVASAHSGDQECVFTTRLGTPHDHRNVAGRALARAIKQAEIDTETQPAPTFHSFRHGFASAFIAAGGDLVELSAHLGHRDPSVTASVYAQEFEKATRSDARRTRIESMYAPATARGAAPG